MSDREQILENLIIRYLRAEEITREDAGRFLLCGCQSCLAMLCLLAEVEDKLGEMPPAGVRVN